jgi:gamma-glutamyltranspeptidase/glutathione hydrolase
MSTPKHNKTKRHLLRAATLALGLLFLLPLSPAFAQQPAPATVSSAPEAATGLEPKTLASAKRYMIAAANPLAVEVGLEILKAGGSATDAAISVQLVLNLVEPQSSGLGGGAFLLHYDAKRRQMKSYDGRETAPVAAKPDRFLKPDGTPRGFMEAVFGGDSVGSPGLPRMLALAHKRHGKLPWSRLFEPALKLATDGFAVSPRLNKLLADMGAANFDPTARAHYFDTAGKPHPVGHILKSPEFAATLKSLADEGAEVFYRGPIADSIVKALGSSPTHKGDLTLADLAAYQAKERPALCTTYRRYKICSMGPPSSGGLTIAQTLALLEPFDLGTAPMNPNALHLIAEAEKLAYADRDQFIGDPDQVTVPAGLMDPGYLRVRRKWIDSATAKLKAEPGTPPGLIGKRAQDSTIESNGTSHISIIDAAGNAVSLTTTIENAFGSRLMASGFLLNNQLTDFSFRPTDAAGNVAANAVAPGKRPRSSMAPTIILDAAGRVKAVIGSPGGSRIILYVTKAIVGIIDWKLDAQSAIDLANFGSRNGPFEIETALAGALPALHMLKRGHLVVSPDMTSGLHIVMRAPNGSLTGGADPRREGIAKGE